MASKQPDSTVKLEDRIFLAINAYQNGQFKVYEQQQQQMMCHILLQPIESRVEKQGLIYHQTARSLAAYKKLP
jgi:hypothetical protein